MTLATLNALLGILGQVGFYLFWIVVGALIVGCCIAAFVYWLYRLGVRDERREAAERAWRLAHPIHARTVKPVEATYFVPDPTMPYDPPAAPVCIVQGPTGTYADGGNAAIRPPAGRTQA